MRRLFCSVALLSVLPACVAAIGNTGFGGASLPRSSAPLLQEMVDAAKRVVELRQRLLDDLRAQAEAGRAGAQEIADAEIALEEARIRMLQLQVELTAVQRRKRD